jgi:hypothetical protein
VVSARLSIVETALEEIMTRLSELSPSDAAQGLSARAERLDRVLDAWLLEAPTEERRREVVKEVLDLAVDVTQFHRSEMDGAERAEVSERPVPADSEWRVAVRGPVAVDPPARASAGEKKRRRRG